MYVKEGSMTFEKGSYELNVDLIKMYHQRPPEIIPTQSQIEAGVRIKVFIPIDQEDRMRVFNRLIYSLRANGNVIPCKKFGLNLALVHFYIQSTKSGWEYDIDFCSVGIIPISEDGREYIQQNMPGMLMRMITCE